jgi:hypothetical protein
MNLRVVKGKKKKHSSENQKKSLGIELWEYYYIDLHRLNCSRHRVHYLASKSDSILLRNVQSQKLHILI